MQRMQRFTIFGLPLCLLAVAGCSSTSGGSVPRASDDGGGAGGGACGPGTITVTDQGSTHTADCFGAIAANVQAAKVQMASNAPASSSPVLTVGIFFPPSNLLGSGQPCDIHEGQTLSMSDPCLGASASYGVVGQQAEWVAFGGGSPTDPYSLQDPALLSQLTGSVTVNQWSTQVGGTLSVTFSSDATLLLPPGSGSPTVTITGSATATISP